MFMITLSKIAKLAHVSISTVSKSFSMSPEVNEQTREVIFSIAREHGSFKKYYNAKYPKFVVAVICAYDYMAIGAMKCILDHDRKIPEDIAVIGINNIPECEYLNRPLASIDTICDQLCCDAVSTVVAILEGEEVPPKRNVENKFLPRRSAEY